jgi:hypothetical protein
MKYEIVLSVIMLSVIMPNVIMPNVIIPNDNMRSVVVQQHSAYQNSA